jgi:hypothetical protein
VAANVFVGQNDTFTASDSVEAFGHADGPERLFLTSEARNVFANATLERFDFAQTLDALSFQVTVRLVGLDDAQDSGVFNQDSFVQTFSDSALIV